MAAALDVDAAVIGFGKRAVVDPDVRARTGVAKGDEVPVFAVVVALRRLIPLPQLVEFQIANHDVEASFHIPMAMADARAVC